jgi:acyl-CoA synthetase (NDP forming)
MALTGAEKEFGNLAAADLDWYRCLVSPRRVAVVGASTDPAKGSLLRNLLRLGFTGPVIPVNPNGGVIEGLPVATDMGAIEGQVDLALIAVAAERVPDAVRRCAEAGVSVAYIMSAGFAELGERGAALEKDAVAAAAGSGMRLVGPNSNGMISARSNLAASIMTSVSDVDPPLTDDRVAVISQSGAIGAFVLTTCLAAGLAIGTYFSTGNECDVGFEELFGRLVDDDQVKVVLAYVEGLRDGPAFVAAARRAEARGKPVVVLKVGVTAEGATASASHTAAMAGVDVVYDGVMRQLGVRRAMTLSQLVDAGVMLRSLDGGGGNRIGVVTISGGLGIMATDEAVSRCLQLPSWSPSTARRFADLLPGYVSVGNPLDTSGGMADNPALLAAILRAASEDDRVDTLLLALGGSSMRESLVVQTLLEVLPDRPKPVVVVWIGAGVPTRRRLGTAGIPCFARIEDAVAAISLSVPHRAASAQWVASSNGQDDLKPALTKACHVIFAARRLGRQTLDEVESKEILRAFDVPCVTEVVVASGSDVRALELGLAFPVVAKLRSPQLPHKSDVGGVLLGLGDLQAAVDAVEALMGRAHALGIDDADIVLQQQVPVGVELILGAKIDETFGPVVSLGIGGVTAEITPDVGIRLPDLRAPEVEQVLADLRSQRLLDGFRAAAPVSRPDLAQITTRFGKMIAELSPWIKEVDVNPLVSRRDDGKLVAVDALMVLR